MDRATKRSPQWILGSAPRDFAFLILPGLIGLALAPVFGHAGPNDDAVYSIYALFTLGWIDSGHVYTTLWRTYLSPRERGRRHPIYWAGPLAVIVGVSVWQLAQLPALWSFIVYATIFHNVRQFFGINRWYQKVHGVARPASGRFLYALTMLPVLAYHFRAGVPTGLYTDQDLWVVAHPTALAGVTIAYGLTAAAWIACEVRWWMQGAREYGRISSIWLPATLYGVGFFTGQRLHEILFALLLVHGIGYIGLMTQSLERLGAANPRPRTARFYLLALSVTAVAFGTLEWAIENELIEISGDYVRARVSPAQALVTALYLTPLLCHYIFDAYLWTGRHPEAKLVFGPKP